MGYETKLIVGVNSKSAFATEPCSWFSVYAMIDLCYCGHASNIAKIDYRHKGKNPLVYWFADDGNTRITEDLYGNMSKLIPIKEVIKALEKDTKISSYRRFTWALNLLKSMDKKDEIENLEVVFFGH